jgi:hypothetical protein
MLKEIEEWTGVQMVAFSGIMWHKVSAAGVEEQLERHLGILETHMDNVCNAGSTPGNIVEGMLCVVRWRK